MNGLSALILDYVYVFHCKSGRRGGFMVSVLDSGANGPGLSPGRGHCVVFLGKTLYSHGASLYPGVCEILGVTLRWTGIPSRGE